MSLRHLLWRGAAVEDLRASLSLEPGQRVADLGCGRGELGRLLLPGVVPGVIEGFDADPDQIEAARRDAPAGLRFEEGDARGIDRPDASYDRVVCQALLVHQSRPAEVVDEMVRLARPGGRVGVIEPNPGPTRLITEGGDPLADDLERRWALAARGAASRGLGSWDASARLADWMRAAGLHDITLTPYARVETLSPPYSEDAESLRDDLLAWEEGAAAEADTLTWLAGEEGADPGWLAELAAAESAARAERVRALRRARWSGSVAVVVTVATGTRSL